MKRGKCSAPALNAKRRAILCGKPATTERTVKGVALPFCARCAAAFDAKGKGGGYRIVSITLEAQAVARVDAMATALAFPGATPNRSRTLRAALLLGIEALEAERAKGGERGAR